MCCFGSLRHLKLVVNRTEALFCLSCQKKKYFKSFAALGHCKAGQDRQRWSGVLLNHRLTTRWWAIATKYVVCPSQTSWKLITRPSPLNGSVVNVRERCWSCLKVYSSYPVCRTFNFRGNRHSHSSLHLDVGLSFGFYSHNVIHYHITVPIYLREVQYSESKPPQAESSCQWKEI